MWDDLVLNTDTTSPENGTPNAHCVGRKLVRNVRPCAPPLLKKTNEPVKKTGCEKNKHELNPYAQHFARTPEGKARNARRSTSVGRQGGTEEKEITFAYTHRSNIETEQAGEMQGYDPTTNMSVNKQKGGGL